VFHLGHLSLQNKTPPVKTTPPTSHHTLFTHNLYLDLQNVSMAYYPKVKSFHAKQEQHKFNLIDDFALRIQLHLLRKEMTPNHHSTNILSIEVPALKVKMSPSIYRSLLELPSHVSF
jgi:hypothetical protein